MNGRGYSSYQWRGQGYKVVDQMNAGDSGGGGPESAAAAHDPRWFEFGALKAAAQDMASEVSRISVAVSDGIDIGGAALANFSPARLAEERARQAQEDQRRRQRRRRAAVANGFTSCLFWVLTALLWYTSWTGQNSGWQCARAVSSAGDGSVSEVLHDNGEAAELLHETNKVMFWLTFGWPIVTIYFFCAFPAVMGSDRDNPVGGACVCAGVTGVILLFYLLYVMFLWVKLFFTVFAGEGLTCAAAVGPEVRTS